MPCHHTGAISKNIENKLIWDFKNCTSFNLALTESTDTSQLATFVHNVSVDINMKEEILNIIALIETTCGIDLTSAWWSNERV